jgi:2,3-bisphosphoglycerate-dependent phosphoglycerate mutase
VLTRAIRTLWIVLDELDRMWLPVIRSWRLNERHYGALQGERKEAMRRKVGSDQVQRWRRGYDDRPPLLEPSDPRLPDGDPRYRSLASRQLPRGESLRDSVERTLEFWNQAIAPTLEQGHTPLVVAHGNSLRGLVQYLEGMSKTDVSRLEIPTGRPLVYRLGAKLRPLAQHYL